MVFWTLSIFSVTNRNKTTTFRKLDLLPSSGKNKGQWPYLLGPLVELVSDLDQLCNMFPIGWMHFSGNVSLISVIPIESIFWQRATVRLRKCFQSLSLRFQAYCHLKWTPHAHKCHNIWRKKPHCIYPVQDSRGDNCRHVCPQGVEPCVHHIHFYYLIQKFSPLDISPCPTPCRVRSKVSNHQGMDVGENCCP
jgi:hypothetical protein